MYVVPAAAFCMTTIFYRCIIFSHVSIFLQEAKAPKVTRIYRTTILLLQLLLPIVVGVAAVELLVGLDAGGLLVFAQVRLEREGLAAPAAGVRLGVRVRLDVSPQVGLVREGLGADVAAKRPLPCKQ